MLIYVSLGAVGLVLLFVMLVASSFGDHDIPIHDTEIEAHGDLDAHGGPSPFGTRVIAAFLTFFGMGGIIGQHLGWSHPVSSLLGIVLGALAAFLVHRFALLLHDQQASSGIAMHMLVEKTAHVLTAIPEDGVGEVMLTVGLEETVQLARSKDGKAISAGGEVVIRAVRGGLVVVEVEVEQEVK